MRVTGENPRRTVEVAGERAADTRAGAVSRGGGTPEARSVVVRSATRPPPPLGGAAAVPHAPPTPLAPAVHGDDVGV